MLKFPEDLESWNVGRYCRRPNYSCSTRSKNSFPESAEAQVEPERSAAPGKENGTRKEIFS